MAHFAKVVDGTVEQVTVVANEVLLDENGDEQETLGQTFLTNTFGEATWVQCSYNENIKKRFPGVGDLYDADNDLFHKPKPYPSWILNTTTGYWEAPITKPTVSSEGVSIDGDDVGAELDCRWDEDAYQADNTTGWVVLTMDLYTGNLEDTGVY